MARITWYLGRLLVAASCTVRLTVCHSIRKQSNIGAREDM